MQMILRNINPCVLVLLGSILFFSCNKGMDLRCENSYLNSVGENVENCECKPGRRPSGGRLPVNYSLMPRSWDGMNCEKMYYIGRSDYLPVYTTENIGNRWIEKGLLVYYDDFLAFRATSPEDWDTFYGRQDFARIKLIELPNYEEYEFANFYARSMVKQVLPFFPVFHDTIQIDLRILPGGYGYTDDGEGIFISYRKDRTTSSQHFLHPMIHLTAPGDDSSFIPIRSYPIEELE